MKLFNHSVWIEMTAQSSEFGVYIPGQTGQTASVPWRCDGQASKPRLPIALGKGVESKKLIEHPNILQMLGFSLFCRAAST